MMLISPQQCRAARAMLGWSQGQLAEKSQVAKKTIADFERVATTPQSRTLSTLRDTLEGAGIVFIAENGGGAGIRMKAADR